MKGLFLTGLSRFLLFPELQEGNFILEIASSISALVSS